MDDPKNYLTTGEVAVLFSVSPDTALRWARDGKIPSIRTPGGHFRVHRAQLLSMISNNLSQNEAQPKPVQYCWEFHSQSGQFLEACRKCSVYRVKASRCYEMMKLSDDIGHAGVFCNNCCQECKYYKLVAQD